MPMPEDVEAAASEAERLRDEIERLKARHNQLIEISAVEIRKRDDEIERLRRAGYGGLHYDLAEKQRQEIERLRDEIDRLQDDIGRLQGALSCVG